MIEHDEKYWDSYPWEDIEDNLEHHEFNEFKDDVLSSRFQQWDNGIKHLPDTPTPRIATYNGHKCHVMVETMTTKGIRHKRMHWDGGRLYSILVPRGIQKDIENRCRMSDGFPPEPEVNQLCCVIVGLICAGQKEDDFRTVDSLPNGKEKTVAKRLSAQMLQRLCKGIMPYKQVLNLLVMGGIISIENGYSVVEHKCKLYTLTPSIAKRAKYEMDLTKVKPDGYPVFDRYGKEGGELVSFLLWSYEGLEMPSTERVDDLAKTIDSENKSRNGKLLKYKESNDDFPSADVRNIKKEVENYSKLIKRGLRYPRRSYKCPRVTDSFNQMPFWIRKDIKIDGEELVELDFAALHPNLCFLAFRNNIPSCERDYFRQHLAGDVHGNIAIALHEMGQFRDVDVASMRLGVKKEHLSYFNDMKGHQSGYKVDKIYSSKMPCFLELVRQTKRFTYKNTSSMLFQLEVDLMTEICRRFYLKGIRALYVYDALYVPISRSSEAKNIMNSVASDFGLLTGVDIPKYVPFDGTYRAKFHFVSF